MKFEIVGKPYQFIKEKLSKGEMTSEEICSTYINRIKNLDGKVNAFLELNEEKIITFAKDSDERRRLGKLRSEFDGLPIGIKDNICIQDEITSCSSKMLENFMSPYSAGVIENLVQKGFILFPRTNMDEFAMGSSTENSYFKQTKNPFDLTRIPGGSSGGSAAVIASSMLPISLGSDTGGSIRQPASLCGIFGFKPTYGRVSRYGLVAFASSLDQIGPFSSDMEGIIDVFSVISGKDERDSTSSENSKFEPSKIQNVMLKDLKIGVMKNLEGIESDVLKAYNEAIDFLKNQGSKIVELDFSNFTSVVPIYYIIATAECSSNLSRFDGIHYGYRDASAKTLRDLYVNSRTNSFGKEVKRRILLGTFSLSSGYYDAFYGKAQKARVKIIKEYDRFFRDVDFILQPTSPTTAFKLGEKLSDPVQMYKSDVLTISANLAGLPAINIPMGFDSGKLPIGLQITGKRNDDSNLLSFARKLSEDQKFQVIFPENL